MEDSRVVTTEQALQVQKDFDFDFFMEASAKTGINAEQIFIEAAKLLYKEYESLKTKRQKKHGEILLKEEDKTQEKKRKCC